MSTRTFTRSGTAPFTMRLAAVDANITVAVVPGLSESTITLTGDEGDLAAASVTEHPGAWKLSLPAAARAGALFTTSFGSFSFGSVSGPVQINGRTLNIGQRPPAPRLSAQVRLPAGSSVDLSRLEAGSLVLRGSFARLSACANAAGIDAFNADIGSISVRTVAGPIATGRVRAALNVESTSGPIFTDQTAPTTRATSVSGEITVHASGDHPLTLATVSGNITVHPGDHRPRVHARSVSGRVRT